LAAINKNIFKELKASSIKDKLGHLVFWGLSKNFRHSKKEKFDVYRASVVGSKEFYFRVK
jgi:hypothetical protein